MQLSVIKLVFLLLNLKFWSKFGIVSNKRLEPTKKFF